MKKIGIMNLTYDTPLYRYFDNLRYIQASIYKIPILNIYNAATPPPVLYPGDFFVQNGKWNPTMYNKLLVAYNVMKEKWNVDYIIRTNASTYVSIKKMQEYIEKAPLEKCYMGRELARSCISGCCIIFSKDIMELLYKNGILPENHPMANLNDDVVVGEIMKANKIQYIDIPSYRFESNIIPSDEEIEKALNEPIIRVRNDANRQYYDTIIWQKLFTIDINGGKL